MGLFLFCSDDTVVFHCNGRQAMQDVGLDRQGALVLAAGWLVALWITLT